MFPDAVAVALMYHECRPSVRVMFWTVFRPVVIEPFHCSIESMNRVAFAVVKFPAMLNVKLLNWV